MMLLLLTILLPATAGTAAYFIRPHRWRRRLWGTVAGVHFALSVTAALTLWVCSFTN